MHLFILVVHRSNSQSLDTMDWWTRNTDRATARGRGSETTLPPSPRFGERGRGRGVASSSRVGGRQVALDMDVSQPSNGRHTQRIMQIKVQTPHPQPLPRFAARGAKDDCRPDISQIPHPIPILKFGVIDHRFVDRSRSFRHQMHGRS